MRAAKIISLSVVAFAVLSVPVTLLWLQWAPQFTSVAVMELRPQRTAAVEPEPLPEPQRSALEHVDRLAAKYICMTRGERVLQHAISMNRVRNTVWFCRSPDDCVQRLSEDLSVTSPDGSGLIYVSLTGTNREELPEIVNAVAEAAESSAREMASRAVQDQIRHVVTERTSLDGQRDRLRAELAKLRRRAGGGALLTDVPATLADVRSVLHRLKKLVPPEAGGAATRKAADPAPKRDASAEASLAESVGRLSEHVDRLGRQLAAGQGESAAAKGTAREKIALAEARKQLEAEERSLTGRIHHIDEGLVDLRILLKSSWPLVVMQRAGIPRKPTMPRWEVTVPAGMGVGLLVGVLLAVGLTIRPARQRPAPPDDAWLPVADRPKRDQ